MTTTATHGMPAARSGIGHRLPGIIASLGGVLYVIVGLRFTFDHDAYDAAAAVLSLLWCLGCLTGLVGIARLDVAGRGLLGRSALIVSFAGLGLVLLAWLTGFGDPRAAEESALMIIGRILTMLGFLCLGIATLASRRWTGWRRLSPLFYPLAAVLGGLSWAAAGVELTVALIGLAWVGIGAAIATSNPENDGRVPSS
jgi:hypothetical protein